MFSLNVINLSGNSGSRLWLLSGAREPKQRLPLNGNHTLLKQAAFRVYHKILVSLVISTAKQCRCLDANGHFAETLHGAVADDNNVDASSKAAAFRVGV